MSDLPFDIEILLLLSDFTGGAFFFLPIRLLSNASIMGRITLQNRLKEDDGSLGFF